MKGGAGLTGGLTWSQTSGRIKTPAVTKTARGGAWIRQDGDARHAGNSGEVGHAPPQGVWEAEQQKQTCDHGKSAGHVR